MLVCRYDKDANTSCCPGCEDGCLEKRPAAYINRDFENAVKEMEANGRCSRIEKNESKATTL